MLEVLVDQMIGRGVMAEPDHEGVQQVEGSDWTGDVVRNRGDFFDAFEEMSRQRQVS